MINVCFVFPHALLSWVQLIRGISHGGDGHTAIARWVPFGYAGLDLEWKDHAVNARSEAGVLVGWFLHTSALSHEESVVDMRCHFCNFVKGPFGPKCIPQ